MGECPVTRQPQASLVKLVNRPFMQDPYPALAAYRETGSAVAVESGGFRMWLVTGYDDARTLLADPLTMRDLVRKRDELIERTVVRPERKARIPRALRVGMLDRDGEDHRRLRAMVSPYFTPAKVAALRPRIERLVDGLIDALPAGRPVDLVEHFSLPATATVMAGLLGLPLDDGLPFPRWVNSMLTGGSLEETETGALLLSEYTKEFIAYKRTARGEDITSDLLRAVEDGAMDDLELESTIGLLLIAGMEPASTISSAVFTLLRHPEQLAALRADPRLLPGCVEEVMRFESPFRMLPPRYREQPYRVGDVTIPANEFILVSSAAANRDPRRFEDPDRFDIRRDTRGHLGFSHGVHRCLGAELGRLEVTVALGRLLAAFPEISLGAPVEEIRWRPGTFMRRLYSLPVVLARRR